MDYQDFGSTEERLSATLEGTNCGTWLHQFSNDSVDFDQRAQQLLGITRPSLSMEEWLAIVHPDDRSGIAASISRGVDSQKEHINVIYRVVVNGASRHLKVDSFVRYAGVDPVVSYGLIQDVSEIKKAEEELVRANRELENALLEVKTLRGILPTCSFCKKIRLEGHDPTVSSSWVEIETYISEHSEARFSHGLCPDCYREIYGDDE